MTTTVLDTKIEESHNKICNTSVLVNKTDYDAKILEIEEKYFTTADYNKFTSDILDAKMKKKKKKELENTLHISNVIINSFLNTKLAPLATKAELKAEQEKIVKLQAFDCMLLSCHVRVLE